METAWCAVGVHSTLDGAEHLGHRLPLVEQDRRCELSKGRVRVGPERSGFVGVVQADHRGRMATSRGGLAGCPCTGHEHSRGRLCQKLDSGVGHSGDVVAHADQTTAFAHLSLHIWRGA